MTSLTIIIVTYNSRGDIDACLGSLSEHPPSLPYAVVVVDSQSQDGTADHVRRSWPAAQVIDAPENRGFAAANNLGFRASAGDLVLLLNPDARLTAGALDTLIGALAARPDAAAGGPRLVDLRARTELSFGPMIGPAAELRQKLLVRGHAARLPLVSGYVERITRRPAEVDWVSGACLLVRRADADAVGLLDERFFLYTEDVDFCAALRARGRRVLFVPGATVIHARGRSRASASRASDLAYRRSQLAFYDKHHPRWSLLLRVYLKVRRRLPDR